jgi:spermidine synthase
MLFVTAVALHGELYRLRPEAGHATHLYLAMAVGGLLGGLFCAIVAPMIFDWTYEHPLLLVAAALLIPQRSLLGMLRRMWESRLATPLAILLPAIALFISLFTDGPFAILTGLPAMLARIDIILFALVAIGRPWVLAMCLAALMLSFGGWQALDGSLHRHNRTRSYFGIYTVTTGGFGTTRILTHGTTMHGLQSLEPNLRREPTTYYAPRSGVGLAMRAATTLYGPAARIGVVGLGTGTLACYALPGQDWRFFEIDPAMVAIAARGEFTYLRDCAPDARIVIGDARLSLSRQPAGALDLLALDAFSSDAVPTHLLTREAFAVYGRALQRKGILLVHISNRFVDLVPVVAANAAAGGWSARISTYVPTPAETARYASVSIWIALARDQQMLDNLELASRGEGAWGLLDRRSGFDGWSDDHASILPVLKPVKLEPLIPKETDR